MSEATEPDLRMRIPERFREGLSARFDASRAEPGCPGYTRIAELCELCGEFGPPPCGDYCPFGDFTPDDDNDENDDGEEGCIIWMNLVLGEEKVFVCDESELCWRTSRDDEARKQLAELRERAAELIEWVEDEPADKES